jgi:outer membrane protein OmpA-like peptidoglycan-associated protein
VSKGKLLAVSLVWLLVLGIGVLVWKMAFAPAREAAIEQQKKKAAELQQQQEAARKKLGGSTSRYRHTIDFRLDAFSGYALLRSEAFRRELGNRGIRLNLHDDGADYLSRIQALKSGDADMAVFTIDALIKVCAEIDALPATIVALVDETTGADAIVAYEEMIPNLDALNRADMRFVLTPNSPSETLARVVMSRFDLDNLGEQPFIEMASAAEVLERYTQAKPTEPVAYVLWEPFVSQMRKNPATHTVVDSGRFPSTIVDVVVAADDFVTKNEQVVREFVESYLRVVYQHRERQDLVDLVMDDARRIGAPLAEDDANKLVDGIWWKNTQENLAHMGHLPDKDLMHLEDMISNITDILVTTGGIAADPTQGNPSYLFYGQVFEQLRDFHPGVEPEEVREVKLAPLTDAQWERLSPVGTARVPPLVFARGTDRLTEHSRLILDELAQKLTTTRFYVVIRGNASRRGNPEANKRLAEQRAQAAERYLVSQGIAPHRIRAVGVEPSGTTSVSFLLGQLPY